MIPCKVIGLQSSTDICCLYLVSLWIYCKVKPAEAKHSYSLAALTGVDWYNNSSPHFTHYNRPRTASVWSNRLVFVQLTQLLLTVLTAYVTLKTIKSQEFTMVITLALIKNANKFLCTLECLFCTSSHLAVVIMRLVALTNPLHKSLFSR